MMSMSIYEQKYSKIGCVCEMTIKSITKHYQKHVHKKALKEHYKVCQIHHQVSYGTVTESH